jgi:hypothetical protein
VEVDQFLTPELSKPKPDAEITKQDARLALSQLQVQLRQATTAAAVQGKISVTLEDRHPVLDQDPVDNVCILLGAPYHVDHVMQLGHADQKCLRLIEAT